MNLPNLCSQVAEISQLAADFIMKESAAFDRQKVEFKGLNDMVSYVDKEAEQMIVERLHKILPQAGFIAEEGTGTPIEGGLNWVIDPLDGTTNFIHGIPYFSVSIALVEQNTPILGVVNDCNHKAVFYGTKGGGAYCNGKPIFISPEMQLSQNLIVTGFPYNDFSRTQQYLQLFTDLMPACQSIRRMGSAALDLAYVACGRFGAFYEYNLKAWDVAAGTLLVREAGGRVTDFSGNDDCIFSRELLGAGHIHPEMLSRIQTYFGKS
jgi:myo-inositol-1(or 4)-monophosphatase